MNLYNKIWEAALRKIQIRPHSVYELERKLMTKFPEDRGTVLKVLEEMERVNLLNDRQFTEQFVSYLIQKPIGRLKIMVEARKRGLDPDLVESLLLDLGWNEEESAKKALAEKDKTLNEPEARKRKMKLLQFLRNRGFRDRLIYKTLALSLKK